MPETFIGGLNTELIDPERRERLKLNLHNSGRRIDDEFRQAVLDNWHTGMPDWLPNNVPAYAIDGSSRHANLTNGSTLFVAQALIMGESLNQPVTDIEILPGTVRAQTMDRFADLMRQSLEIGLAREYAEDSRREYFVFERRAVWDAAAVVPAASGERMPRRPRLCEHLLDDYRRLFMACEERHILLISIAKTNRQALFSKILQRNLGHAEDAIEEISDSALFDGLTERKIGYSTPVMLGTYGFSEGSATVVLEREGVKEEPTIISFFVRLADLSDTLRIDVPTTCIGREERLGEVRWSCWMRTRRGR